jgi:hypothetical protein
VRRSSPPRADVPKAWAPEARDVIARRERTLIHSSHSLRAPELAPLAARRLPPPPTQTLTRGFCPACALVAQRPRLSSRWRRKRGVAAQDSSWALCSAAPLFCRRRLRVLRCRRGSPRVVDATKPVAVLCAAECLPTVVHAPSLAPRGGCRPVQTRRQDARARNLG